MKRIIYVLIIVLPMFLYGEESGRPAPVAEGDIFPELIAQDLTDEYITLPGACSGKVTLICISFSRPEEGTIESWTQPFAENFRSNTNTAYYEIAMIGDVGFVSFFIFNGIKSGTPDEKKKNLLVFWKDKNKYRDIFGAEDGSLIYSFLLDKEGRIARAYTGKKAGAEDTGPVISEAEKLLKK